MTTSVASLGPFVGILGGMGPLATVDLMGKIVAICDVRCDQDHIPVVAHNVAQIPDRQSFLSGAGPSPLPAMLESLKRLNAMGAGLILMPCNTAHIWFDELAAASAAPFVHIADAALSSFAERNVPARRVGIVATPATIAAGFYQERLLRAGLACDVNTPAEMATLFNPGCHAVKANDVLAGGAYFHRACEELVARGADTLLLACTEVPVGLAAVQSSFQEIAVDATQALAMCALTWWNSQLSAPRAQSRRAG